MSVTTKAVISCAALATLGCDSSTFRVHRFVPTQVHVHNTSPLAIGSVAGPDGDALASALEGAFEQHGVPLVASPTLAYGLRKRHVQEQDLLATCDVVRQLGGGRLAVGVLVENSMWPADWEEMAEEADRDTGDENDQLKIAVSVKARFRMIDVNTGDVIANAAVAAETTRNTYSRYEQVFSTHPE